MNVTEVIGGRLISRNYVERIICAAEREPAPGAPGGGGGRARARPGGAWPRRAAAALLLLLLAARAARTVADANATDSSFLLILRAACNAPTPEPLFSESRFKKYALSVGKSTVTQRPVRIFKYEGKEFSTLRGEGSKKNKK